MATITVSTDSNHDDLTTRVANDTINITSGATLTIDSTPTETTMGVIGVISISEGTLRVVGTSVRETTYSSGTGTLPAVGDAISWDGGAGGTGKVIELNSGDATSGVMTITVQSGDNPSGTITDGAWSATVDSDAVGFMKLFLVSNITSVNALSSIVMEGEWYEIGVGDGTDGQTFTLPHQGIQAGVWVETGSGTNVFEKWIHTPTVVASTVFYDSVLQYGNTYQSGYVFEQATASSTITFGTSTNGGVPPSGARIRIPNLHVGTTTVGSPTTEVITTTINNWITLGSNSTNVSYSLDKVNLSTVRPFAYACGNASFTSCTFYGITIGLNNGPIYFDDCVFWTSTGLTGEYPNSRVSATDNVGGITFNDCNFMCGINNANDSTLLFTTCENIYLTGTNKVANNQQDENTAATLKFAICSNIEIDTLISLAGRLQSASTNDMTINMMYAGWPPGRGATEANSLMWTSSNDRRATLNGFDICDGGAILMSQNFGNFTDASYLTIRNIGSINSKLDAQSTIPYFLLFNGISNNITLQRIFVENLVNDLFSIVNTTGNYRIENCSGNYDSEIELDASNVVCKGLHSGSGDLNTGSGLEGDMVNCIGTCFVDYFKSDTTGAVALVFNDPAVQHAADVEITSGTPRYNALGDLTLKTTGDQIVYSWPHWIKGHTGFQNAALNTSGVNETNNTTYEYDLDTGSGYSGTWKTIDGTNLSAETISPTGFKIKVRITVGTDLSTRFINGLEILTTTTLAAQENNFYPLDIVNVDVTVRDADDDALIENAVVYLQAASGGPLPYQESVSITSSGAIATVSHPGHGLDNGSKVVIRGADQQEYNGVKTIDVSSINEYTYAISGSPVSPATGTVIATAVVMLNTTDVNGYFAKEFSYTGNQPVAGRVRKATSSPLYKNSPISGTITSNGLSIETYMIVDE